MTVKGTEQRTTEQRAGLNRRIITPIAFVFLGLSTLNACTPLGAAVGAGAVATTTALEERPFTKTVSDAQIKIAINDNLFQENLNIFRHVNIAVTEGKVLLTGNVQEPDHRVIAVREAWKANGVREVVNEIEVNNDAGFTDYTQDVWIATQLKSKLLFDKQITSINYNVETVNQNIYLMGIAQDQTELNRAIAHAKDIDYVKRVVSYVVLKDDPARSE
ncbi:BON domain-containing protein [Kiloniella laminariae]|uniref:BON domain-containing protein n=1 Tax=Kiloniella laminariae TaxID=454162 RepID=UPI00036135D0|nr:BON domain-containing protein [Kiloniella laminariae]